ncbi:MAG: DNA alkylation repair protein [Bacteroides sp.]|jgi:3-methyladenine DNA glycosylase AlkD|nr:DNA alkylation repair protein [Bacteroides sp.]
MTAAEILKELKAQSNEKVMAHNRKYGAGDNQFGVKMGDIRALAKKIKKNHPLALELWETTIIDARLLACLIVDNRALTADDLDELVRSIDFVHLADWFNAYVLKDHPDREVLRAKWMEDADRWAARSGWALTAEMIAKGADGLDLEQLLNRIEKEMPTAPPEVQWTMNFALAYIGIHHPQHRQRALAIGNALGIYRDYPVSKGCTSPFAPIWINEMVSRMEGVR